MNVRRAQDSDYESVMQLYNGLVGEDRYSRHDRDSFTEVIDSPEHAIFVADKDGRVIGVASVSIRRVVRYNQPIAELDELYVDPKEREHGVGRALIEASEVYSRDNHCYRLFLESHYQHKEAHKFYEAVGYENYGFCFKKDL